MQHLNLSISVDNFYACLYFLFMLFLIFLMQNFLLYIPQSLPHPHLPSTWMTGRSLNKRWSFVNDCYWFYQSIHFRPLAYDSSLGSRGRSPSTKNGQQRSATSALQVWVSCIITELQRPAASLFAAWLYLRYIEIKKKKAPKWPELPSVHSVRKKGGLLGVSVFRSRVRWLLVKSLQESTGRRRKWAAAHMSARRIERGNNNAPRGGSGFPAQIMEKEANFTSRRGSGGGPAPRSSCSSPPRRHDAVKSSGFVFPREAIRSADTPAPQCAALTANIYSSIRQIQHAPENVIMP